MKALRFGCTQWVPIPQLGRTPNKVKHHTQSKQPLNGPIMKEINHTLYYCFYIPTLRKQLGRTGAGIPI